MINTILDRRYKIVQTIAQGGFGQTYLAKDLKRPGNPLCVVKQLKPQNTDPDVLKKARELFRREAEILERLGKHPQIPQLLAYEETDFYLVQEYISGHTLAEEFENQQAFSESQVINLISELLTILDFVHSNNVIHRDLKPPNIMIAESKQKLVLIDFGAVKQITEINYPGTLIGTPGYAAPEQMHGMPSYCSDLYAVGIIGIQALTGIHPHFQLSASGYNLDRSEEITWKNKTEASKKLVALLDKLRQYDRRERYQSAREAIADLQKLTSSPATTIQINSRKAKDCTTVIKRHNKINSRKVFYILMPVSLILFGFLGITRWQNNQLNDSILVSNKIINSTLDDQDVCDDLLNKVYCERYTFTGQKGQQVEIELNSQDFDPYLVLQTPEGNKLQVSEDISPNNWNAKIVVKLPVDGKYDVIARTSVEGESGSYSLRALLQ